MTPYIKMKKKQNRNPVKQLFITFPKSNIDKSEFRDSLLRFEPDYYKVCEEKHKDGTPHLHAVVRFKNKYSVKFVVDYFKEVYPDDYKRIDVQPVRSIKNSLKYLSKEDPNPLESCEFKSNRNPQQNKFDAAARQKGFRNFAHECEVYKKERESYNQWWIAISNAYFEQFLAHHEEIGGYKGHGLCGKCIPSKVKRAHDKLQKECPFALAVFPESSLIYTCDGPEERKILSEYFEIPYPTKNFE